MSAMPAKPSGEPFTLLRTLQAKIALSLLFVVGLSVQGFRVLSAWQESQALESEVGALSAELLAEASASNAPAQGPGRGVPIGRLPGPILLDAVRLLNEAEIYDYRYRFLEVPPPAASTPPPTEGEASDAGGSTLAIPETTYEEIEPAVDEWPMLDLPAEVVPAPTEWKEWRLELEFDAAYPRATKFLALLGADERMWTVPRLVASRDSGMLTVDCVLKTYTRAEPPMGVVEETVEQSPVDQELVWTDPGRDPFRGSWSSRGVVASGVAAPSLGGVLLGAHKRAWLDGRAVELGGRVGGWTVTDIRAGEVVLKHDGGATVRLAARGRAGDRG